MANQGINLPSSGGGLMRFSDEYKSKFMLKPSQVVLFIIVLILGVVALKLFLPVVG